MARKAHKARAEVADHQRKTINEIWRSLLQRPIRVSEGLFQCQSDSLQQLHSIRSHWGVASTSMTEDGRQRWPDAANAVIEFTEPEFADFVARVDIALAVRRDRLYTLVQSYKAQLPLPPDHPIFDSNSVLWQDQL